VSSLVATGADPKRWFVGTERVDFVIREGKDFAVAERGEESCVEGLSRWNVLDVDADVIEHVCEASRESRSVDESTDEWISGEQHGRQCDSLR